MADLSYNPALIENILRHCPCRRQHINKLLELFGEEDELAFPNIFIHGNTGTGKSHVVTHLMNKLALDHVFINCIECYSTRILYHAILESLSDNEDQDMKRCDNMNDFLRYLKQFIENKNKTFYIIIDKAERLRQMDANLLPALLRLSELTKLNICVIFITEMIWEKFLNGTCFPVPVQLHFNDYSQNELVEIMSLDCPDDFTVEFFASYCRLLISVFHLACRDLNELKHLALLNFPKYCEPLTQGEDNDVRKLWRNIEPHLRKCLSTVYLREVSDSQWEEMQQKDINFIGKQKIPLELPYLSKYLLIAAYLASHNPSRTDRRFFCKRSYGKMSKRAKTAIKNNKSDEKLTGSVSYEKMRVNYQSGPPCSSTQNILMQRFYHPPQGVAIARGPKAFPLDRLMAIFYSIIDDDIDCNASLLIQVSTLVTLNLLVKVSADDQIDCPKYKCLVHMEFIQAIADNLDFNLSQYLCEQ